MSLVIVGGLGFVIPSFASSRSKLCNSRLYIEKPMKVSIMDSMKARKIISPSDSKKKGVSINSTNNAISAKTRKVRAIASRATLRFSFSISSISSRVGVLLTSLMNYFNVSTLLLYIIHSGSITSEDVVLDSTSTFLQRSLMFVSPVTIFLILSS